MATLQHKFQTLVELTLILADESSSSAAVMSTVMRHAASLVEADRFSLFEVDHANKQLVTKLSEGVCSLPCISIPFPSKVLSPSIVWMTLADESLTFPVLWQIWGSCGCPGTRGSWARWQ